MHLSKSVIRLYSTRFGLTDAQRKDAEEHLFWCEECAAAQKQFAEKLQATLAENELECQFIENDLAEYLLGELTDTRNREIENHLASCSRCRFLFDSTKKALPEDIAISSPGSTSILKKITRFLDEFKETVGTIANLTLNRPSAIPAFLGKHPRTGLSPVSHSGGDLCLNVHKPLQKVSLFTADDLELQTQKSDEFGIVLFHDFLAGQYQVGVEGYEVAGVHYLQPAGK